MKRTCCSHKDAQFVCISQACKQNCSYLCSTPNDKCKQQHQSCSLVSLNYVTKKCMKIASKQKKIPINDLNNVYTQTKKVLQKLQFFLEEKQRAQKVKNILDPHGLIQRDEKQLLIKFVQRDQLSGKQPQKDNDVSPAWIQKQLINLNIQISTYLKSIKEDKRQLEEQYVIKQQSSSHKMQSRLKNFQTQKKQGSAIDKVRGQSKGPTPVRCSNNQIESPLKNSKVKVLNPGSSSNGFQTKISSVIVNHVPIGPLFSKITNNLQTLQTFFYQKFSGAKLLYRASQNGFLASKFHQKCDGIKNTLTILITQHNKIIGGYTPLPWKNSGDWYEDETESSFIFSLTSGERFPLSNKTKAIWCNSSYGPSFGHPDLQIANKAFYNENSCVNFPQFYNNGNYEHSSKSIEFLCGTKTGHFKIRQWEVYELEF